MIARIVLILGAGIVLPACSSRVCHDGQVGSSRSYSAYGVTGGRSEAHYTSCGQGCVVADKKGRFQACDCTLNCICQHRKMRGAEPITPERLAKLEGKSGFIASAVNRPDILHVREDCPVFMEDTRSQTNTLPISVKNGKVTDEKGLFHNDVALCGRCVE